MNASTQSLPLTFSEYRKQAGTAARALVNQGKTGEFDEQALPAYSHPNVLMRWLFWQRLRKVSRHLRKTVPPGSRVLDFGCGVGMLLPLLAEQKYDLTGVDLDIRYTTQFLEQFGITGANILHVEQMATLPPASFDAITALDVLEHVPDLDGTIRQLAGLLKPGGKLIVCGPTENFLYKIGRKLAGFSGDYHVRDIKDIHLAVQKQMPTVKLGTLYPFMPLFRLFEASKPA
jgi:2-polyprenyl-3-methyl-5-hydroxy-6-metoxy-1,4-benzoquinol methylase